MDKLPARLRILFRERIKALLETSTITQSPLRVKLVKLFIECAGDKEYAIEVMLSEGSKEVVEIIKLSWELREFSLKILLQDLRSSAPFDKVRALSLVNCLVSGLNLVAILNGEEDFSKTESVKRVLEEILMMAWEDWSIDVRELCINVISNLGLQNEIHKGILLQLESTNCTKQIAAIKRVGEYKIEEGLKCLVPCLVSAHIMIRIEAFRTVAMFNDISDRLIMGGIMAGCVDIEPEVRIVSIQGKIYA